MALSNFELEDLGKILGFHVEVCLQDQLQMMTANKQNGKYIINLGNLQNGGTHWVALQFKKNVAMYFDSFGAPPPPNVITFAKNSKKLGYSNQITQAIESELCGWYCLAFLYYNLHTQHDDILKSTNQFTNMFSHNADFNAGRLRIFMDGILPKQKTPQKLYDLLFEKIKYK